MRHIVAALLAGLLTGTVVLEADQALPQRPPAASAGEGALLGPLAASASREVRRLARSKAPKPFAVQAAQPRGKGWIKRHPKFFGALVGFGAGCVVGASQVGGSEDTWFNALDESACPVVGGIGAAAGALIGALIE